MISARKIGFLVLLALLCLFLQSTVLRSLLSSLGAVPNLMLVMAVFIAFLDGSALGVLAAFLLGLLLDLSSALLLGPWAGAFVVVYAILASLSQRIFIESTLAVSVVMFFSSILANAIYLGLASQFRSVPHGGEVIWSMAVEGFLTALLSPLLFKIFRAAVARRERGRRRAGTLRMA